MGGKTATGRPLRPTTQRITPIIPIFIPMSQYLKSYGPILLINMLVLAGYLMLQEKITGSHITTVAVVLGFAIVASVFKYRRDQRRPRVFTTVGNQVTIKGRFKTRVLNREDIKSLTVSKNFFARIFDLSLVTITTPNETIRIYCTEIKNPGEMLQL